MNLKVLKLENWQISYANYDQGIDLHDAPSFNLRNEAEYPYLKEKYPRVDIETNYSDNQYLYIDICLFVVNGVAYKNDIETFKYDLEALDTFSKITRVDKIKQLYKLEVELFGEAQKKTRKLKQSLLDYQYRRSLKKGGVRFRRYMMKRVKKIESQLEKDVN